MNTRNLHHLDAPLQRPTEAERCERAIRKLTETRQLVLDLGLRWMNQFQEYRRLRDAGDAQAEQALSELVLIERASTTAEWLLHLAEAAHRRLLTGLSALLVALLTMTGACIQEVPPEPFDPADCAATFEAGLSHQPELPLRVRLDPELPESLIDATLDAVQWWNHQGMGELITGVAFASDEPQGCGWIGVSAHDFTRPSQHGRTVWNACWAEIDVQHDLGIERAAAVIAHELGHAMNLPHEQWVGSIMYPMAQDLDRGISQMSECLINSAVEVQ